MLQAWDSDGHVFESEATFSDLYLERAYRDRRPVVAETDSSGTLAWIIDSRAFPTTAGPNQAFGGPPSKNGIPSPKSRTLLEWNELESVEFRSAAARIKQMDREKLEVMVNYPTVFLAWPLTHDPLFSTALCRSYNNWISDISSQAPDRLKWVTVIDPQDPNGAAKEIKRTKEMGSVGVMLLGMADQMHVGDPSLEPIWKAAAETGLPVGLHVGFCCAPLGNLYSTASSTSVVPFGFVVLMAFESVMASGVLDRYPNLRVAFLEAGCQWVHFMVERVTEYSFLKGSRVEKYGMLGRVGVGKGYNSKHPPREYIQRGQVYFGFEVDDALLPKAVNDFGADHFLFASDIPHSDRLPESVSYFEARQDIDDQVKRKLLIENTARYYDMPLPK